MVISLATMGRMSLNEKQVLIIMVALLYDCAYNIGLVLVYVLLFSYGMII